MTHPTESPFTDPAAVARYAEGPRRNVPGYDSLLPMVRVLLAERVPANGRVLVVGAGGGLECSGSAPPLTQAAWARWLCRNLSLPAQFPPCPDKAFTFRSSSSRSAWEP